MVYIGIRSQTNQPAELSSVALNINGQYIDQQIDNFKTLKVAGRETLSNELDIADAHEGTFVLAKGLPARELVITYSLSADNGEEFQNKFKQLRKLLDGQLEVRFNDEPNVYYYGVLASMETVPDHTHDVVASFTLYCANPHKYGPEVTTSGQVTIDTFYNTLPTQIRLTINNTTNRIAITDGVHTISATGTFNAGTSVVIHFAKEAVTMTVNNVEATYMIDLNSDLENFYLVNGRTLRSSQGSLTLVARERWL